MNRLPEGSPRLIVRALRTHDDDSQRLAYAAFDEFRAWVRATHPEPR